MVTYRNVLPDPASSGQEFDATVLRGRLRLASGSHSMRNPLALLAGALLLAAAGSAPVAAQAPAEPPLEGCASELETHCAAVTAGEGRLLACLYAYGDKLSRSCELGLYETAVRLERAISTLTYIASQCRAEIGSLCTGTQAGAGQIAQCLHDHTAQLSEPCERALAQVGLNE
jgi:hypothetical protein